MDNASKTNMNLFTINDQFFLWNNKSNLKTNFVTVWEIIYLSQFFFQEMSDEKQGPPPAYEEASGSSGLPPPPPVYNEPAHSKGM